MSAGRQTVLVTGAAGFLGRHLCEALSAAGFRVCALVRNPESSRDLQPAAEGGIFRCNLLHEVDARAFQLEARALIHCAYETRSASARQAWETNMKGTQRLVGLARDSGIPQLVFVSSLAAHEHAASAYGRAKYGLEDFFKRPFDTIVKPATIVGPGGVFQRVREIVRRAPVLPLFYADRALQTVWIDDVCTAIVRCIARSITGSLVIAHPEPVPLREFYTGIAALEQRRPLLCPFPGDLALLGVRLLERAGLKPPISSENILGIKRLRAFDSTADLARLGIHPRSFQESLQLHATYLSAGSKMK